MFFYGKQNIINAYQQNQIESFLVKKLHFLIVYHYLCNAICQKQITKEQSKADIL